MKYILCILILLISIHVSDAKIQIDFDHKITICFEGCHDVRGYDYGSQNDECGNCHKYNNNKPLIEAEHNPKICNLCHSITTPKSYHNVHLNVSCVQCHPDGRKPQISYNSCASCHKKKIHTIHESRPSCETCHGVKPSQVKAILLEPTKTEGNINIKNFTLFEFIKRIFIGNNYEK